MGGGEADPQPRCPRGDGGGPDGRNKQAAAKEIAGERQGRPRLAEQDGDDRTGGGAESEAGRAQGGDQGAALGEHPGATPGFAAGDSEGGVGGGGGGGGECGRIDEGPRMVGQPVDEASRTGDE